MKNQKSVVLMYYLLRKISRLCLGYVVFKKTFYRAGILIILGLVISLLGTISIQEAGAGLGDNVRGWAWSENIGWVGFNNIDTGGPVNYGVNIDSNGVFSGYAWAGGGEASGADVPAIGWISFADFDGDGDIDAADKNIAGSPCTPNCEAKLDLDGSACGAVGRVCGWARALSPVGEPQAGSWDGWLKLRGPGYGVNLDSSQSPKEFTGWAWGGDDDSFTAVIGLLSFNVTNCDVNENGIYEGPGEGAPAGCPVAGPAFDYKVETSFSFSPTAENLSVGPVNHCTFPAQYFNWDFVDPDPGDIQGRYRLQVDKESDFLAFGLGEVDVTVDTSITERQVLVVKNAGNDQLDYNEIYWWRLMVWDDGFTSSNDWIYPPSPPGSPNPSPGVSFGTEIHIYPRPDFTWIPPTPTVGEFVQFCSVQEGACIGEDPSNLSKCYDNNNDEISCSVLGSFLWVFPADAEFSTSTSPTSINPVVRFTTTGDKDISLTITDNAGACTKNKSTAAAIPLPTWKETSP